MKAVPQIRIFLASPADANEERAVALEVLDMLEHIAYLRVILLPLLGLEE